MPVQHILADQTLVLTSTHGVRLGSYRVRDELAHWHWTRGVWPRGVFEARSGTTADGIGRLAEHFAAADDAIAPARWHDTLEGLHGARRLYRITTMGEEAAGLLAVDTLGLWWIQYEGFEAPALPGPLRFEPIPDTRHVGAIGRIRLQRRRPGPVEPAAPSQSGRLSASRRCRG